MLLQHAISGAFENLLSFIELIDGKVDDAAKVASAKDIVIQIRL